MNAMEKQAALVSEITDYYTYSISSQTDSGDYIKFDIPNNEILLHDKIDITGVSVDSYNKTFAVYDVSGDEVTVAKEQSGFTLDYDDEAVFSNAYACAVRVFDNLFEEIEQNDSTFIVVDIEETYLEKVNIPAVVEQETMFPIMVIVGLDDFSSNEVLNARERAYTRMIQILNEIGCKVTGNLTRTETVFGSVKVTVIASIIEK